MEGVHARILEFRLTPARAGFRPATASPIFRFLPESVPFQRDTMSGPTRCQHLCHKSRDRFVISFAEDEVDKRWPNRLGVGNQIFEPELMVARS